MEKKEFEYRLGNRIFVQRPLVLGQLKQLSELLEDINLTEVFSGDKFSVEKFLKILGKRLPKFIAIVLREPDKPLREKNLKEIEELVEEEWTLEQALQVVRDFFVCNNPSSLIEKLALETPELKQTIETTLKKSSSSSQTETSPKGKKSSGAIH